MNLQDSLAEVRQHIAEAAQRAGRRADEVRLVAVSKRQPLSAIKTLMSLGQKDFGENQMQEAVDKIAMLEDAPIEWHFIGHLQSNKTRHVGGNFSWVHTVDSAKLARRIARSASDAGRTVNLLLQVNVSGDPAKHGIEEGALFPLIETVLEQELPSIRLCGLMTIGYRDVSETETRRSFARLRERLETCRTRYGDNFSELSMGMSSDYVLAIEEGATLVRVGSALFGERLPVK
jgi:pyridoxal phosphate enzyme (YggS family)